MIRLEGLNDTIVLKISQKQQKILSIFLKNRSVRSSFVRDELLKQGDSTSLVTVKRTLSEMAGTGLLRPVGKGRSTAYEISVVGRLFAEVDAGSYCASDPDKRFGLSGYNFNLFSEMPNDIFSDNELASFNKSTAEYEGRTADLPEAIRKKELERLVIELSWKSSKIEGNTYTLLDTEKLILENKEAPGHDRAEARMILNHKDAFYFVHENAKEFQTLTRANLEKIHEILVKDLGVGFGFRLKPVGVLGSKYRPLDNGYQIAEAVEALSLAVLRMTEPCAKAMVALLGLSYIQPFEDGNKRTSRLMANAILLAHGRAPLSYRSADENEYREAMLVFYELNSLVSFKELFIEQYEFAALNYAVK